MVREDLPFGRQELLAGLAEGGRAEAVRLGIGLFLGAYRSRCMSKVRRGRGEGRGATRACSLLAMKVFCHSPSTSADFSGASCPRFAAGCSLSGPVTLDAGRLGPPVAWAGGESTTCAAIAGEPANRGAEAACPVVPGVVAAGGMPGDGMPNALRNARTSGLSCRRRLFSASRMAFARSPLRCALQASSKVCFADALLLDIGSYQPTLLPNLARKRIIEGACH